MVLPAGDICGASTPTSPRGLLGSQEASGGRGAGSHGASARPRPQWWPAGPRCAGPGRIPAASARPQCRHWWPWPGAGESLCLLGCACARVCVCASSFAVSLLSRKMTCNEKKVTFLCHDPQSQRPCATVHVGATPLPPRAASPAPAVATRLPPVP